MPRPRKPASPFRYFNSSPEGMILVTTSFDIYFERARRGLRFGLDFQHHPGPILPIPRDDVSATWRSLVYLHGRLGGPQQHLVLTSAEFDRAYLTEGRAARFIVRFFADFTVLFLGYSLNDPVLRYMTDAFAAENSKVRIGQRRGPAISLPLMMDPTSQTASNTATVISNRSIILPHRIMPRCARRSSNGRTGAMTI